MAPPRRARRPPLLRSAPAWTTALELYGTTDSFENEALGSAPRAAIEASMVTVVQRDDTSSSQVLRLHDTDDDAIARIAFPIPQGATAGSLRLRATELPGAMLMGLRGPSGSVLHLAIDADGALRRYALATEQWEAVAPAGTINPFSWVDVTLRSDGVIELDGRAIDTGPVAPASIDQMYVTSTGTVPVGVDLLIDDWAPRLADD